MAKECSLSLSDSDDVTMMSSLMFTLTNRTESYCRALNNPLLPTFPILTPPYLHISLSPAHRQWLSDWSLYNTHYHLVTPSPQHHRHTSPLNYNTPTHPHTLTPSQSPPHCPKLTPSQSPAHRPKLTPSQSLAHPPTLTPSQSPVHCFKLMPPQSPAHPPTLTQLPLLTPHTATPSHPHTHTASVNYPTTAAEIIDILRKKICFLSGGRANEGQSLITFPAKVKNFEYNRDELRRVIQYLASIPM